jgi:hypothetical protein
MKERRGWWENFGAKEWPWLAKAAVRLLAMHATSCAAERNWSLWGSTFVKSRNRLAIDRANKLIFLRGNNNAANQSKPDEEITMDLMGEEDEQQ